LKKAIEMQESNSLDLALLLNQLGQVLSAVEQTQGGVHCVKWDQLSAGKARQVWAEVKSTTSACQGTDLSLYFIQSFREGEADHGNRSRYDP
jgi:hypothetical protein